jgi:2-dehydro-3-deoxyphosphogluconate aldolase/(4S)-4-hydroxy-2-oxoglutarate aldolase
MAGAHGENEKDALDRVHSPGPATVIRGPSLDQPVKMAEALVKAGVPGIEITYSTPSAVEVKVAIAHEYG